MSRNSLSILWIATFLSVGAFPAYAVEAPVYEADDYASQDTGDTSAGEAVTSPAPAASARVSDDEQMTGSKMPDDEPPASTLTQGQRIDRLEQQVDNLQHSESVSKISHFQEEIQTLRGKVEELTHQLEQAQGRQQAMYTDLEKRIASKPVTTAAESVNTTPAATAQLPKGGGRKAASQLVVASSQKLASSSRAAQPNVAEEQQTYQQAYDLIKAEKYDQAVATLQQMLHKYPSGQFAANAHYWLGELYGLQGKNDLSAAEFQTVLKQYPGSPRMADAGLKLGLIYAAEFKWHEAKSAFHNVINRYPGTASARLAAEQLKQIRQSDH